MASVFSSYIYQIDKPGGRTIIQAAGGQLNAFSPTSVHIYPTTETGGINNIQMNAIIELLPSGLNQPSSKYFSAETVSALETKANTADS